MPYFKANMYQIRFRLGLRPRHCWGELIYSTPLYLLAGPSVLWRCWLGSRRVIRPVKNWVVGWGAGMVICLKRGADLYIAQMMPLPLTVSNCFSKTHISSFTFLLPTRLTRVVNGHILKLKCTTFDFGRGSAPHPAGGAYSAPQTIRGPTSNWVDGREGRGPTSKARGREGNAAKYKPKNQTSPMCAILEDNRRHLRLT